MWLQVCVLFVSISQVVPIPQQEKGHPPRPLLYQIYIFLQLKIISLFYLLANQLASSLYRGAFFLKEHSMCLTLMCCVCIYFSSCSHSTLQIGTLTHFCIEYIFWQLKIIFLLTFWPTSLLHDYTKESFFSCPGSSIPDLGQ